VQMCCVKDRLLRPQIHAHRKRGKDGHQQPAYTNPQAVSSRQSFAVRIIQTGTTEMANSLHQRFSSCCRPKPIQPSDFFLKKKPHRTMLKMPHANWKTALEAGRMPAE
jgi:hypothetical protein